MIRHAKAVIQYAAERFREPSTQAGIAGITLIAAHSGAITNDTVVGACNVIGAVCGGLAILMPDDKGGS